MGYGKQYFDKQVTGASDGADAVLSVVFPLVPHASVVDLGCGRGAWLKAAADLGATDILGIDGPWVAANDLLIPAASFRPMDFAKAPLPDLGRRFDLAISCEVAEHVAPEVGDAMVAWLCRSADAVLFSAAIPGQGGRHHVNEQWPSYWAARFAAHGFAAFDIVRPAIWADRSIPVWYRQNCLLMAPVDHPSIKGMTPAKPHYLDRVHPEDFEHKMRKYRKMYSRSFEGMLKRLTGRAS